jgi:SLT domain-containing protein
VDFTRYAGGGDINAWIAQACQAAGVPANNNWVNGLLTLSQRESGNDPNTVNTTDVNATGPTVVDGHPQNCSRGVAQVIPSTFLSFHTAGTSWAIYDPAANIAAAIGYIRNRYHVSLDGSDLAAKVQQADPTRAPAGY